MAYKSKYYDPVKAHEYYLKHRKLKSKPNRGSVASLNDEGKIAAAEVKEKLQEELKAALAKLPKRGSADAKKRLREEYKEKYYAELDKMREDPSFSKAAKSSTRQSGGGAKSSSSKASGSKAEANSSKAVANSQQTQAKASQKKTQSQQTAEALGKIESLLGASRGLSEDMQAQLAPRINALVAKIGNKLGKGATSGADSTIAAMGAVGRLTKQYASMPESTRALLKPVIQDVINRISSRLGITAGDIEAQATKSETTGLGGSVDITDDQKRKRVKRSKNKVQYSRVTSS